MAETSRDPRFRPFRLAAYGVYLVLVFGFCGLLIYSVIKSVRELSPSALPPSENVLGIRECVERAESLFAQLESEREGYLRGGDAREVGSRWSAFRVKWLTEFREVESRCAPASTRSRAQLRPIFVHLENLQDLYATEATQFGSALGPEVEKLRSSLKEARKDPGFGRLP